METPVRVDHLTKRFGRTTAVRDISIAIPFGVTGLLGPNGAGKTTLLRILATVLAPDGGRVEVFGQNPDTPQGRLAIRRRLGYVPQETGFHRNFTTFEFVDYVAILKEWTDRRARHDEVRRVLRLVDLTAVADRKIKALSGGMRRRLTLAQALLGDPRLLVLDEPTAGLDPEQRMRFRDVVSSLATHRAIVLSTHQTEDVAALCDQAVVIDEGLVRFAGTLNSCARSGMDACGVHLIATVHPWCRGAAATARTATSVRPRRPAGSWSSRRSRTPTCCCLVVNLLWS